MRPKTTGAWETERADGRNFQRQVFCYTGVYIGVIMGLVGDNGKSNGSYYVVGLLDLRICRGIQEYQVDEVL